MQIILICQFFPQLALYILMLGVNDTNMFMENNNEQEVFRMANTFDWVEIKTKHIEETAKFY